MDAETYELTGLELERVDLVTAGANPGARILIAKADTDSTMSDTDATLLDKPEETLDVQPDGVDINMADDKSVDTVAKADFEALQTQLAEQIAKADAEAEARKAEIEKAAALEERIAKMESERKQAEFIAKARDYSNLGKADELGPLLLAASDHFSEDQYKMLERLLKAANAQVEKGALFAQFSKTDGDEPDVMDRINTLAKKKVDAGEAKTIQLAKQMVIRENPALRDEYVSARGAL